MYRIIMTHVYSILPHYSFRLVSISIVLHLTNDEQKKKNLKYEHIREIEILDKKYASYVRCIYSALIKKGVTAKDLRPYLMNRVVYSPHDNKKVRLSSNEKIEKSQDISEIICTISKEYASFLDYEIFETLVEEYKLDVVELEDIDQEVFKYPELLKAYLGEHTFTDLIEDKPAGLPEAGATTEKLFVKFEIDETKRLTNLKCLKNTIARILGIPPFKLRLIDIERGCVIMTFLISKSVADSIFTANKDGIFTKEQKDHFEELSVRWVKCKDYKVSIPGIMNSRVSHRFLASYFQAGSAVLGIHRVCCDLIIRPLQIDFLFPVHRPHPLSCTAYSIVLLLSHTHLLAIIWVGSTSGCNWLEG